MYDTQTAIGIIKHNFQQGLSSALNLKRVTAPLFVNPLTGLNDNLNGTERPVSFDIANTNIRARLSILLQNGNVWRFFGMDLRRGKAYMQI